MKKVLVFIAAAGIAFLMSTGCKKETVIIPPPCDTSMLRKVKEEVQPNGWYLYTGLIDRPTGTNYFTVWSAVKMTKCEIANDLK